MEKLSGKFALYPIGKCVESVCGKKWGRDFNYLTGTMKN